MMDLLIYFYNNMILSTFFLYKFSWFYFLNYPKVIVPFDIIVLYVTNARLCLYLTILLSNTIPLQDSFHSPLLSEIVRFDPLRIVVSLTVCFKTRLLGRSFHTFIRNVSLFFPIDVRSHSSPLLRASVLVGTMSCDWF